MQMNSSCWNTFLVTSVLPSKCAPHQSGNIFSFFFPFRFELLPGWLWIIHCKPHPHGVSFSFNSRLPRWKETLFFLFGHNFHPYLNTQPGKWVSSLSKYSCNYLLQKTFNLSPVKRYFCQQITFILVGFEQNGLNEKEYNRNTTLEKGILSDYTTKLLSASLVPKKEIVPKATFTPPLWGASRWPLPTKRLCKQAQRWVSGFYVQNFCIHI